MEFAKTISMDPKGALERDLLAVLRRAVGPDVDYESPPTSLAGGFWAQLVRFRLRGAPAGWGRELVARVMPDSWIAAKETAIRGMRRR